MKGVAYIASQVICMKGEEKIHMMTILNFPRSTQRSEFFDDVPFTAWHNKLAVAIL